MTSRKIQFLISALTLAWTVFTCPAYGQNETFDSSLDRLVGQMEAAFPPVEGVVVSLEGLEERELLLDLKQGDPIRKGNILNLIRYGKEITHPTTGKKLGRQEKGIGRVKILKVGRNFSLAKIVGKSALPREGDGVRLPFKSLSILVAPLAVKEGLSVDQNRVALELEKKLRAHPRFDVPSSFNLGVWMLESGVDENNLQKKQNLTLLSKKANADYVLFPSARKVKEKSILGYRLVSIPDGKVAHQAQVVAVLPSVGASAKIIKKGLEQEIQTDFGAKSEKIKYVGKQEFPFEIVDFDVGDITGNGKKEYVIIDRNRVMVYRFTDGKLKKVAQYQANKHANKFISVDLGDINGNGKDEIFVTSQYDQGIRSFALEADFKKKRFKKVWDKANYYFRIIHPFGEKTTLLAQIPDYVNPFSDGIYEIKYQNGKYVKDSKVKLPSIYGRQFILYGLNLAPLNDPKTVETIILDKDYHLRVYSVDGRVLIKSDDYYGHDPRLIEVGAEELTPGMSRQGEPEHFRGRLQLVKFNKKRFLLLPHNHRAGGSFMDRAVIVNNSSLVILRITDEGFEKYFETKKQKGFIAAYQAVDDQGKKKLHAAMVDEGGLFTKTVSTIYTYDWNL